MCRDCHCTDDEAYRHSECFCLCHTNYSQRQHQSPDGSAPTSVPTLPSGTGLGVQRTETEPQS